MSARPHFNQSGLVQMYRDVAGFIAKWWTGDPPQVLFGARARWAQVQGDGGSGNRVVVVPGLLEGGDGTPVGIVGPGSFQEDTSGNNGGPRARGLFTQTKPITFCLWALDATTPDAVTDEALQQEAIEQMQEFVYRAVKNSEAGAANATWAAHKYNRNPNELRYGTEYQMVALLDFPYFDLDPTVIFPETAVVNRDPAA